jgi:hypothetical protein
VNELNRWTFIAEYDGGTYIRQLQATSLDLALEVLCLSDESDFWTGLLDEDNLEPVPITGIENVWCITGLFNDKLVMAHVVLTSQS